MEWARDIGQIAGKASAGGRRAFGGGRLAWRARCCKPGGPWRVANPQHAVWTKGREAEIEAAFGGDQAKTDLSAWIYNGPGDAGHPSELGDWVGHRIVKAYNARARDKRAALWEIVAIPDPKAFLARSGWKPAGS